MLSAGCEDVCVCVQKGKWRCGWRWQVGKRSGRPQKQSVKAGGDVLGGAWALYVWQGAVGGELGS